MKRTLSASRAKARRADEETPSVTRASEDCAATGKRKLRIAFFGHFGQGNLGNESTLQVALHHLRRMVPDAEFTCICTGPDAVSAAYGIRAVVNRAPVAHTRRLRGPLARLVRRLVIGIPRELGEWLRSVRTLWGTDAMVVPGTGLLHDAYTLFSWGPYDMFRWSLAAKLCRCRVVFLSVGAGPLYTRAGRFFVKTALSLADYRSYRDEPTQRYLLEIGFRAQRDPVYPDLVFSLADSDIPRGRDGADRRPVVGLGLMKYAGRYSVNTPGDATYPAYLDTLAEFAKWLLERGYDVRLLMGDVVDKPVLREFGLLLAKRLLPRDLDRIIDEPIESTEDLLEQLAATDVVVATRFHNVLLATVLGKPVMAISFHHKCSALMAQMGLSEYSQDIGDLNLDRMVDQFSQLQEHAGSVKAMVSEKVGTCRGALDEQYAVLSRKICSGRWRASLLALIAAESRRTHGGVAQSR